MKPTGGEREEERIAELAKATMDLRASLRRLAEQDEAAARLPSAGQLWWRSKILRDLAARDEQLDRVARPIRWAGWGWLFLTFAGLLLLVPQVSTLLNTLAAVAFQEPGASPGTAFSSLGYLLIGLCGFPLGASIVLWWMLGKV